MMAKRSIAACAVILAAAAFLSSVAAAPAPAPAQGLDCFQYLMNLTDCLSFVQNGSNLRKPEKGCCPALANLVDTQPVCLCQLLGHPDQVGIPIDISRAMKLPSTCRVTTPPVSLCAAFGVPVAGLGPSGAPSPDIGSNFQSPRETPSATENTFPSPSETPSGIIIGPGGSSIGASAIPPSSGTPIASPTSINLASTLFIVLSLTYFF